MASEPMTLAEFEREAVKRVRLAQQPDSVMNYERPEDVVGYGLRPLVLRLLAGERGRCAEALEADAGIYREARNHIRAAECVRAAHRIRKHGRLDMTCTPSPGTKPGTWHVLWLDEPETHYWAGDLWGLSPRDSRTRSPEEMARTGWRYAGPAPALPEPPQTAQEIARLQIQRIENGYYGISTAPDILVALHSIAGIARCEARIGELRG